MEAIEIWVRGNEAGITASAPVVAGTVGLPVIFSFDEAWQELTKTAVFRANGKTMDYVNLNTQATVPWELLLGSGCHLWCGVYGCSSDAQTQLPTLWVDLGVIQAGADPSGDVQADPSLPVWQQLTEDISRALDEIIAIQKEMINGDAPISLGGDAQ